VDGADGRTYILIRLAAGCPAIRVVSSDLQHDAPPPGCASAYVRQGDALYDELLGLVEAAR